MDKNLEYEPVRGAHILMIVNPVSGRIGGEHTADKLEAWLKENGAAVDRFETTETENGSGYTAKLAENDYARVVVLGGDGTLNAVLNGCCTAHCARPSHICPPVPQTILPRRSAFKNIF